jgi:predicted oxidoreductase (fatty acid repression mutant protein)
MASDPFFNALIARRTIYGISDASPIPDSRITEIVTKAIQYTPSTFNVQSARAVVIFKDEHKKLWDSADKLAKAALPEAVYQSLAPRIARFRAGYGSVSIIPVLIM